jgi:hypothetical protein
MANKDENKNMTETETTTGGDSKPKAPESDADELLQWISKKIRSTCMFEISSVLVSDPPVLDQEALRLL